MGWMETCAMVERMRFVMGLKRGRDIRGDLVGGFGVSRKTGTMAGTLSGEDVEGCVIARELRHTSAGRCRLRRPSGV